MITSPHKRVATNLVVLLGLFYVFMIGLVVVSSFRQGSGYDSRNSSDRVVVVHIGWSIGYFPAAFVSGIVASLTFDSRKRWLWFAAFLSLLLVALVLQDLKIWGDSTARLGVGAVALFTAVFAIAGFWCGERLLWNRECYAA